MRFYIKKGEGHEANREMVNVGSNVVTLYYILQNLSDMVWNNGANGVHNDSRRVQMHVYIM